MSFYAESVIDFDVTKMIFYACIDVINLGGMILQNGNKMQ